MKINFVKHVIKLCFIFLLISCNNSKKAEEKAEKISVKTSTETELSNYLIDFEKGGSNLNPSFGSFIVAFTDENETPKGTSTINELVTDLNNGKTINPVYEKGMGTLNSNNYLKVSGTVTTSCPYGFIGFGLKFKNNSQPIDVSGLKGVKFWAKGNGLTFVVRLESSFVKDYAYHECEFFVDENWEEYIIPFEYFRQPSWKSAQVNLSDVIKAVIGIQWQTNTRPIKNYVFCIDNIEFIK